MPFGQFETDRIPTADEDLEITFLGHGSLLFSFRGRWIYVDPFSRVADYSALPKADAILITHEHRDHLDPEALAEIRTDETEIALTERCAASVPGTIMSEGDVREIAGLPVEAIPAYNRVHVRENGEPFHPRGVGVGYVVTFGGLRVLIAGDTENTPELKAQSNIDIAFLPMNLPYTMTPEMVADVAAVVRPRILYPYHFGETDTSALSALLTDLEAVEVRLRRMA